MKPLRLRKPLISLAFTCRRRGIMELFIAGGVVMAG